MSLPRLGVRGSRTTYGYFRRDGATVRLVDRTGNFWELAQVSILSGSWGYDDEGAVKLPRPAEFDDEGAEVVLGDRVLILFLDDSAMQPVVLAGFRRIDAAAADFLPYNHAAAGANPNRLTARVQPRDGSGDPVGSVDLDVAGDDDASVVLSVGGPDGGGVRTQISLERGLIELRSGSGPSAPLALGGDLLVDLQGAMSALGALLGGANPATTLAAKLSSEIATPGAVGYTSNVAKST